MFNSDLSVSSGGVGWTASFEALLFPIISHSPTGGNARNHTWPGMQRLIWPLLQFGFLISHAERSKNLVLMLWMSTKASQKSRYETFNTWESTACAVFCWEKNGLFCRKKTPRVPQKTGVWIKTDLYIEIKSTFSEYQNEARLELWSIFTFQTPRILAGRAGICWQKVWGWDLEGFVI